ncbi:MAG: biopolymer transporter ExbD [bacterium]
MPRLIEKKRKVNKTIELYLTPVMNIFLNIIPLLLVTAVFIQTSVINLSLPSQTAGSAPAQSQVADGANARKPKQLLILSIAARGFYLILGDKLLKIIPKGDNYDFDKLEAILRKVKEAFPEQESIVIESEDDIIYDHLIHTMDRCRACGLVDIVLSASKN